MDNASIWLWAASLAPLALLLFLMIGRGWGAAEAGSVGWLVASLTALTVFHLRLESVGLETVKGVVEAVTIVYIIVSAILIYEVAKEADAFVPFQRGMTRLFAHPLLQVMAIGWVFASFLQGITGFGVPIAVCAPLLVGIGVRPLPAVVIALVGHAWNNTFGTLSAAWIGMKQVTDLSAEEYATTAVQTSLLLWMVNLVGGLAICWLYGRLRGVWEGLPAVLVISLAHGGVTLALSQWDDTLNGFAAGLVGLLVVAALARLPRYRRPSRVTDSPVFEPGGPTTTAPAGEPAPVAEPASGREPAPDRPAPAPSAPAGGPAPVAAPAGGPPVPAAAMSLNSAFLPYSTLLVVTGVVLLIGPLKSVLSRPTVDVDFPAVTTGLGFTTPATTSTLALLTHAGTLLLVTAVISYVLYRRAGHLRQRAYRSILSGTVEKAIGPTIAVVTLVAMASVMQGSGQADVLATKVAAWTSGIYLLLGPYIGVFGTFITGSNLSSNLLFGAFQQTTAQAAGLSTAHVLSAQTTGGALGTMISPSKILLGTTTAGISGQEGRVLRRTLPLTLVMTALAGLPFFLLG
ncbi:L-lactate permease [Streptomyces sp. NRRL F-5065]|uniref:L-lactate permease n=1 Tax=Streptomyces sp. NRRL F-5065 TaxID=1463855 RepID=UPI0004C294E3|nr:L-lactate permease [Streptomyces sp. NRRL F-5065]